MTTTTQSASHLTCNEEQIGGERQSRFSFMTLELDFCTSPFQSREKAVVVKYGISPPSLNSLQNAVDTQALEPSPDELPEMKCFLVKQTPD